MRKSKLKQATKQKNNFFDPLSIVPFLGHFFRNTKVYIIFSIITSF
jgi:hypothetical protein